MRKFYNFLGSKFDLRIKSINRKTKTLFKLRGRYFHPACKLYHGVCSCGETYIGKKNSEKCGKQIERIQHTFRKIRPLKAFE